MTKYSAQHQKELLTLTKDLQSKGSDVSDLDGLRSVLRYHEWKYYVAYEPVLTDYEYDILYKKLEQLEVAHPSLITPDSPTQRVSSDLSGDFDSVKHLVPMLSLDNSYNEEDLKKFDEQIKKLTDLPESSDVAYSLEPKYDGGSVALVYENDLIARGATRGNGTLGEDITLNVKTLPSVPLSAAFSAHGIIRAELRGEAVIRKERFYNLNKQREADGLAPFANPRNSAAGGLRMKRPADTRDRAIEIFTFQLGYAVDKDGQDVLRLINTHDQQIKLLGQLGFKIEDPSELLCHNIAEVIEKISAWEGKRDDYPYEIDGMVVKVNDRLLQEKCGYTQHHPRWAIAYKFKAKQAITKLLSIDYQVGKVGSITPVAKVAPVHLAGVTVSSISLHNEEFIKSKDLRIGDQVIVERAGDVIPYIVGSIAEKRTGEEKEVVFPRFCPANTEEQVELVKEDDEAAWRCPSCTCGAQHLQRIVFHVSKVAMDIDGFGKAYVEKFYELGWLTDVSDVYNLDYDQIAELEGFGQKSANNLQVSVATARANPISNLLHSLSIHHLGKKASKLIAQQINNVFDLQQWQEEDFLAIKDIGPVVAKNVAAYFAEEENIEMLQRIASYGVNMHQTEEDRPIEVADDAPLVGKTILFTGSLQKMTRNEAKKMAEAAGAKNISAVSGNLDILVVGEKAGSKLKKALGLGSVLIYTEDDFLAMING